MSWHEFNADSVRAVMVDLDDTLYSYESAHALALTACWKLFAEKFGDQLSEEQFRSGYRQQRNEVTQRLSGQGACRSRQLAFQGLFEQLQLAQAWAHAADFDRLYWSTLVRESKPAPEAVAALEACKQRKLPVAVVSDMLASQQVDKLRHLGLAELIDFMVTSEECGVEKPAPQMFERAFAKLQTVIFDLKHEQVIMIGDSHGKDIAGAAALGFQTLQVKL